ncbi:MAG: SIMPL domain-containing protein [Chloroflexi bacterium]|nr:SIMPL domain-containing protein [Chloroflexota bacterium]
MKVKTGALIISLLALLGLLAAACGGDGDAGAAPGPAGAALQAGSENGWSGQGITVSGQGTITAEPDTALLSLGVSVLADTARDARDRAAAAMNKLLDSLKANGIDEKDIKTTQFSLSPEYDYSSGRTPRLIGYRVTNTVSVKVRELDRAPEVIDEAVDAVGDPLQISGVTFTVDDPSSLLSGARADAMADAQAKAQQLADLGGVDLGKPIAISETSGGVPSPIFRGVAGAAAAELETPIQPGQLDITVSVQVTYGIE